MSTIELAIDLGSSNVTINQVGVGLMLREPSLVIAYRNRGGYELQEVGHKADNMLAHSLGAGTAYYPVREGVVVDAKIAGMLIGALIKKVLPDTFFPPKVKVLALISSGLSTTERKDVEDAFKYAGIKDLVMAESPLAILAYTDSIGGISLDIGGGTSEIAAITRGGIHTAYSLNIAGNAFNQAIMNYLSDKRGVKIGAYTAERIKLGLLSMYSRDSGRSTVSGRDTANGSPLTVEVTAQELRAVVLPLVEDIVAVVKNTMASCPSELVAETSRKGVFVSGGSAQIPGLLEHLADSLNIPVVPLDDIENAVAIGGGKLLENKPYLSELIGVKV